MTLEELGNKAHEILLALEVHNTNAITLSHIYTTDKGLFSHLANKFIEASFEHIQYLQGHLDTIAYRLINFETPQTTDIFDNYINKGMKEQPTGKAISQAFRHAKRAEEKLLKHVPYEVFEEYETANARYNALNEAYAYTDGFMKGIEYVRNGGKPL